MKRWLPLSLLLLAVATVAYTLRPPRNQTDFDLVGFSRLPVLLNGRVKPFDTVARTTLLVLQGRQRVVRPDGHTISPTEWLLDAMVRPDLADAYQTIEIVHPDLLALFSLRTEDGAGGKRFSYNQLKPHLDELERQARLADSAEGAQRSPFQKATLQLYQNLVQYDRLQHSLMSPDTPDFLAELKRFESIIPAGLAAVHAKEAGQTYDQAAYQQLLGFNDRYDTLASNALLLPIPPAADAAPDNFVSIGRALRDTLATGRLNPHVLVYAGLAETWRRQSAKEFNEIVRLYSDQLASRFAPQLTKSRVETTFNSAEPFYTASWLYVLVFLLAVVSWLKWPEMLGRCAFWLLALAFVLTTAGIVARMWLEGRPPVTNLYSSALFVGWIAVALCLVIEAIFKNAIGSAAAGLIGLGTLIIAHHLALSSGETMEMMRAVLDSNFWLATHVVTIAVGYGATYLAGFLALIYIFRGLFTKSLDAATADALSRMVYGIVCFATLFSFVGTILGGIWADQSWGRFWGWDPKENGALIIVLWNALILHALWGGLVKQRGLMCLAVFGNIVTSWSWWGVNMLGVGLHSYGFMDAAFWWLIGFVIFHVAVIFLASLPLEKWRSFAGKPA